MVSIQIREGLAVNTHEFKKHIRSLLAEYAGYKLKRIGISCGGPLDSKKGIIYSPPNLPGWDNVPITRIFSDEFGVETALQNDANACALAEWLMVPVRELPT